MSEKIKIELLFFFYFLIAICISFGCNDNKKPVSQEQILNTTSWYESKVQINYQNGAVDTVSIDVYENLDNIKIENGNLSYWKATKKTGGTVSYVVHLASYVRSFKVLNIKYKHITE